MNSAVLGAASALVLCATAAVASAQPALTPLQVPAQPAPPLEQVQLVPQQLDYKDPGTATLLSIGGTVAPIALLYVAGQSEVNQQSGTLISIGLAGLVLGPSLGHWYAHDYLTGGLALRGAGSVLMLVGLGEAFSCFGGDGGNTDCNANSGTGPILVGAGLFVTGTIYDIATAGRSANQWNTAHVRLVPTVIASAGHQTMGVGLGGTF